MRIQGQNCTNGISTIRILLLTPVGAASSAPMEQRSLRREKTRFVCSILHRRLSLLSLQDLYLRAVSMRNSMLLTQSPGVRMARIFLQGLQTQVTAIRLTFAPAP